MNSLDVVIFGDQVSTTRDQKEGRDLLDKVDRILKEDLIQEG